MTSPSAVRTIALDKLVLSPTNVRKTPPSAAEEAELKASIRARGLKQNLVVHPAADATGFHAVTAGGRRLKALKELAAEGVIAADFTPVSWAASLQLFRATACRPSGESSLILNAPLDAFGYST